MAEPIPTDSSAISPDLGEPTDSSRWPDVPGVPRPSRRSVLFAGGGAAVAAGLGRPGGARSAAAATAPWPERLSNLGNSTQVVIVHTPDWSQVHGCIQAWEKVDGAWVRVLAPHHANIGARGWILGDERIQGDRKSPAGIYRIHKSFGYAGNPGTKIAYNHLDPGDYWAGDQRDPKTYNVFQSKHPKTAKWRKSESEALYYARPAYQYVACIDFNLATGITHLKDGQWIAKNPANVKIGSGIFLHCYGTTGVQGYTLGCVSTRKDRMKWLLRWFRPSAYPRIVMGPVHELVNL